MKLSNGTEIITKPYQKEDAEEIVNLIIRNFRKWLCEEIHGNRNWELDTILQESKNCHLYEKMGYHQTDKTKVINEKLTLTFYEKKEVDRT